MQGDVNPFICGVSKGNTRKETVGVHPVRRRIRRRQKKGRPGANAPGTFCALPSSSFEPERSILIGPKTLNFFVCVERGAIRRDGGVVHVASINAAGPATIFINLAAFASSSNRGSCARFGGLLKIRTGAEVFCFVFKLQGVHLDVI